MSKDTPNTITIPNPKFERVHNKIQELIKAEKTDFYVLEDNKDTRAKLPVSDSIFCAEDIVRNRAFWKGIKLAIQDLKKSHEKVIVVDAGSGTGILGIFALYLWADTCYFLESNKHALALNRKFVSALWLGEKSYLVDCDATSYDKLPEPYHLLISETLMSGFVEEDFVHIIENLKSYAHEQAIFLPSHFHVTINEQDKHNKTLAQQTFPIYTKHLEQHKKINLKSSLTTQLSFKMNAHLHNDVWIKDGSCMSFLNEKIFDINEKHQFFNIIKAT